LTTIDPSMLTLAGKDGWTPKVLLGTISFALIGVGFLGSPQIFVRFLALRDEAEISKGAAVAIIYTLLAGGGAVMTGMVGRALLTKPGVDAESVLGTGAEGVLPMLVDSVLPAMLIGLFIAIVLSAIMSTVDSLLVLASSAVVRDVYQQVMHPELSDESLVSIGRWATVVLALIAVAIALIATSPGQTVFWFVVFGWSGISATFCPTMILSLSWRGFTGRGAIAAMITGFFCVPLFKFGSPYIPVIGEYLVALNELPPSFVLSLLAGVLFSITDTKGREAADVSF
jgi:Na+/proline symporter